MALKGQEDPRWIVEERSDGKNVNNWHWTETDYTAWVKRKFSELLENLPIVDTADLSANITNLYLFEGEVSVNTRKQKTFLFYELEISLNWVGEIKSNATALKGKVHLPYVSEENDDDDFEVNVSVEGDSIENNNAKDIVRSNVIPILKRKIPLLLNELREAVQQKTQLPQKTETTSKLDKLEEKIAPATKTTTPTDKKATSTTSFTISENFGCSPNDIFEALVDSNRVKAYAGGDAQVSREKGGKFALFGGSVVGENLEVEPGKKIVQKWRFSSWPADLYSTVTMTFERKDDKTVLTLKQANVPSNDLERTRAGWNNYFWNRIKGVFGYGPMTL